MNRIVYFVGAILLGTLILASWSCKHDPLLPMEDVEPIDTTTIDTMPVDTMPVDTMPPDTTVMGDPCDPDVIYFDQEVLPIFISNCAFGGCHDAASAQDGVILDSYENVFNTGDVTPFNLDESDIYEVLVDDDEDDRMPPAPNDRLSSEQIQIIAAWILQGAEDLECNPDFGECNTENISFSADVQPVIVTHCQGCHSGSNPSGGIGLATYDGVKAVADNGKLVGAIAWENGFENMPQGGDQLSECTIDQIQSWVDAGAPNN